jgi:hypothetical protein
MKKVYSAISPFQASCRLCGWSRWAIASRQTTAAALTFCRQDGFLPWLQEFLQVILGVSADAISLVGSRERRGRARGRLTSGG